jgi:ABC-type multidrug transport system ATPase subunit
MPVSMPALRPVLLFHLRVGARLALRLLVTATAAAVGLLAFLRIDFLLNLAQLLFGARGSLGSALLVLGAAAAAAAVAAPRICTGLDGWLRHLPVAGATHRRAATAAIALAEAPVLAILAVLVLAARSRPGTAAAPHLAGLLAVAWAAAQLSLPARRRAAVRVLALAAGLLAGLGIWPALAAALPLLAAADLAAGQPRFRQAAPHPRFWGGAGIVRPMRPAQAAPSAHPGHDARILLPARIAWRALGWRPARAYGLALVPLLAAVVFCRNNQLVPIHAARAALLGGGTSCAVLLASLAGALALRRPAWPWARSLPWPARRRVLDDASLLGVACLPLPALAGVLAPAAVPPLAALLPLLAVRAAGAMRRPAGSRLGAAGEILMEGLLLAGLVALLPLVGGGPARRGAVGGARGRGAGAAAESRGLDGAPSPGGRRSPVLERRVIRFSKVSFAYRPYRPPRPVLAGIDLVVSGGLTLVAGPNGCGKSTLLRLAAGIEPPDAGRIEIDGHDLWTAEVAARAGLAFVPEQPDLTPYATVAEILQLVCALRGEPPGSAAEALATAGLAGMAGRSVRELSLGQRRRAVVAAALIGSPGHLLLDEPLESMDRAARAEILAWIERRGAAGAVVLLAAHDLEPFAATAARALTVRNGSCLMVDPLPSDPAARSRLLARLAGGE